VGRLEGRTAVVTGGARGIGRAIAELFLAEGAQVTVWDLEPGEPRAWPGRPPALERVDVADHASVVVAAARLGERADALDVLVNNAGVNLVRSPTLRDLSAEEWRSVLDVNLTGTLQCTQALLPLLFRSAAGRIVNFSSVLALKGVRGQSAYAASKAGVLGLTRVWARELGPRGITVNCVVPGYIETHMNRAVSSVARGVLLSHTALRRAGSAEEVARACLFLASGDASFVSGAALHVDGGLSA
jgi:3-oxoacyl-[acyl-carrier protein] reductase